MSAPLADKEAPSAPPQPVAATPSGASSPKKPKAKRVLLGAVGLAVLVGIGIWLFGLGKESTDDAYITGRLIAISPRVSGTVVKLLVKDNERVKKGQALVELDVSDYKARLGAADADLAASQASLKTAEAQLSLIQDRSSATLRAAHGAVAEASGRALAATAGLGQARASVAAAKANLTLARVTSKRAEQLIRQKAISQATYDERAARLSEAKAALARAEAHLAAIRAQRQESQGGVERAKGKLGEAETAPQQIAAAQAAVALATARVAQAKAARRLAELNLSYTTIRAPVSGIVSHRNVEVGELVDPRRPVLALVPLEDVWVVANFKEGEVAGMKSGQKADVEVDAFGGRDFDAHVDSLGAASGALFSLLPPDNATGNFTKVVQRIPVLIRFDHPPTVAIRPGMSAEVVVHTGS